VNDTGNVLTANDRRFTLALMAFCGVLLAPTLAYRMGLDQGSFAYLGAEILDGRWPYIDTWDHQFPGLMLLSALEILALGKSGAAFRLFDWAYQLLNVYLIYSITRKLTDRTGGYVAAIVYCLIYQGYGPWNTAQREGSAMLFVLWGFWLFLTASRRRPMITAIGIGLGLGIAVVFKPTMLALSTLYAPLLLRPDRKSIALAGAGLTALLTPVAAMLIILWANGALFDFYEANLAFQAQSYVPISRGDLPLVAFWISKLTNLGAQTFAVGVGYLPFLFWGRSLRERRMLYLGYVASVYAVFIQGTFAGYHYLPGLALGAALIGTMFSLGSWLVLKNAGFVVGGLSITRRMALAHLLVLVAIPLYVRVDSVQKLVTLQFLERPAPDEYRNGTVFDFTESWDVAEYLRTHTEPGDRIQVWGHESLVYYLADRDSASRFHTSNPLVARPTGWTLTPMQLRWRKEFMRDVREMRPRYIAVVREDNWWWSPGQQTSEQLLDDFPSWKQFILDRYSLENEIGRYLVYRDTREGG
jgi:hypothetical protein